MSNLLDCPDCGLPAEVRDRFTLSGTPHVKISCVIGHWSTPPVEFLPARDRRRVR
jgi:hypothetical protein